MTNDLPYLELRCPKCRWSEVCGRMEMVRWLRKAGKLRPGREPEPEILQELFPTAVPKLACPKCGGTGLTLGPAREDLFEWPGDRACSACGQSISAERLQAVPDAKLCPACQQAEEQGRGVGEVEYCPQCGAPMALRPTRGSGVTRYEMVCTANPPCRR